MQSGMLKRNDATGWSLVRLAVTAGVTLVVGASMSATIAAQDEERQYESEARAALEEYFRAWNAEDNEAVAAISNFPRVSLGGNGQVVLRQTPEEILTDFQMLRQSGWDRSTLDLAEAVQVSSDKVHFRVVFTRYAIDGAPITTAPGLYIVTKQNDHWGLQLQSVLPPTFVRE